MNLHPPTLGAIPGNSGRCAFRVWAPNAQKVAVRLLGPLPRELPLQPDPLGYHSAVADEAPPGTDYLFCLDDRVARPDPASRWQPRGVHAPSCVADPHFSWEDAGWPGHPLEDYVVYELHVGTFSTAGTFDGVIPRLREIREIGITAIELMPVAQFPGSRNWGYDGVFPFAVQDSYGGPAGLKRLVNAAHHHDLAVVLDVVYNHLGPEGNCLGDYAPYFTDRYRTPWGPALNFDGPHSDNVRRYFIENALYWQTEFHLDALRLDAVHAIRDFSAVPFLEELAATCHHQAEALHRRFHLIAESDLNLARHTLPRALGGYGLDAQWSDDFHHCIHVLLTGEQDGYYADYGGVRQLAKVWREGYAFTGEYSTYRRRKHGSSPHLNPLSQFVVCSQNHDQIGNRMLGDRLSAALSFEQQKLAAGVLLLSPFIPLLFMGQEYGETAPFQFFVSHSDPALLHAVRAGRREEFAAFAWQGQVPDPADPATFHRCQLQPTLASQDPHRTLRALHRELLAIRQSNPAISHASKPNVITATGDPNEVLLVHQWNGNEAVFLLLHFGRERCAVSLPFPTAGWHRRLDSADPRWAGPGSLAPEVLPADRDSRIELPATSFVLYEKPHPH
mgnify:CR=1 FL=1